MINTNTYENRNNVFSKTDFSHRNLYLILGLAEDFVNITCLFKRLHWKICNFNVIHCFICIEFSSYKIFFIILTFEWVSSFSFNFGKHFCKKSTHMFNLWISIRLFIQLVTFISIRYENLIIGIYIFH